MTAYSSAHINADNSGQCGQIGISYSFPAPAVRSTWTIPTISGVGSGGASNGMAVGGTPGAGDSITVSCYDVSNTLVFQESLSFAYGSSPPSPPARTTVSGSVNQSTGTVSLSWVSTGFSYEISRDGVFLKNVTGTGTTDNPPRGWHTYSLRSFASNSCGSGYAAASNTLSLLYNTPPNAPALVNPPNGAVIAPSIVQRLTWQFNDNDTPDTQSAFDLQYRVTGTTTWTSVSGTTPNSFYDIPAGTLTLQSFEWQVRTYDALGAVGPWSSSGFFSTATPPTGPTITLPVNGSTVGGASLVVNWSAPAQASYQVQRVADDGAGAANTAVVYSDTGEVFSTARTATLPLTVNNRREHVQVRVRNGGPWSNWADANYLVSFTPPAAPVILLTGHDGTDRTDPPRIEVSVGNPTPTGTQPPVTSMDIFRSVAGGPLERVATGQQPYFVYVDYTVASGVDYAYQARVYSANGLFADSALTSSAYTVNPDTFAGYEGVNSGY